MFEFVTIAYKMPYYTEKINIYYGTKTEKYYLFLSANDIVPIEKEDFQKGEIYEAGDLWKFTTQGFRIRIKT